MNKILRKLKKSNGILRYCYYFISIFYFITLIFFVKSLLTLKGIETTLRIIAIIFFILYFFIYVFFNFLNILQRKYKVLISSSILSLIFSLIFCFGTYYINVIYSNLDNLTENKNLLYTSYLITLNDTKFDSSAKIGLINEEGALRDHTLAESLYANHKLTNKIVDYNDYYALLSDLYNKKIEAIFVPGNYVTLFVGEEAYQNIKSDTKIIYEYSENLANEDLNITSDKTFNEPLTFLLLGVDSTENGMNAASSFNGDTLMVISFNPKTLDVVMLSIPRDTYVPIACRNNAYSKINSAAAYGTNCVINTISNFIDIDIDYYLKINFKGVVDLVNAVGGVEVDVEKPNFNYSNEARYAGKMCEQDSNRQIGEHLICVDPGIQTLNGEQALAYARNRHLYIGGDLDRVRHQQQVVEALAKKVLQFSSIGDLQNILSAISKNLATNMDMDTILSGYQVAKNMVGNVLDGEDPITINKAYLETYSLPVYLPGAGMYTSAQGYYEASLEDITKSFKETLGIEDKKEIKTFSFSAKEPYEIYSPGKNKRSGQPYSLIPNFVGKTVSEAETYASENGLEFNTLYVDSDSEFYNPDVEVGVIASQVPHAGELLNTLNSLTVYINNSKKPDTKNNDKPDVEPEKEEDDKKNEETKKDEEIIKNLIE